jgi:acid phosphatase type 7
MSRFKSSAVLAAFLTVSYSTVAVLPGQHAVAQQGATLFAVGDIVFRSTPHGADATGRLMGRLLAETPDSRAITLGDNCNDDGAGECYDRFDESPWGGLRGMLYPVPGNHDYEESLRTGGIPHYFLYFPNAGRSELGYYAYDWGGWRILALNSELMRRVAGDPVALQRRDAQLAWLDQELRSAPTSCVLAYFHRPPFSSGDSASPAYVMPIFEKLYKYGVDLYVAGHEHFFAYLPPLSPQGVVDTVYGIPGLIAGTGGAVPFPDPRSQRDPANPQSRKTLKWARDGETLVANKFGVARIDLRPGAFSWTFIPVDEAPGIQPSGAGLCHSNPSS